MEAPERPSGESLRCSLCPRACLIQPGAFGRCGIRGNKNGTGLIPYYGHVTALAMDPIEKKPLYHFRPGSSILSLGFSGCNLHCPFCQNWRISQNPEAPGREMKPADIAALALSEMPEQPAVAYTYSEPLVHAEFLIDCMSLAHKRGIANVLVTNGCINPAAAAEILAHTDAANIDLKCFSAGNYSKVLGGNLDTVVEFIRQACSMGVHVEITTLVVPEFNDSDEELDRIAQFIAGVSPRIPWHLSAYHPDYRWNAPATDPKLPARTATRSRALLNYVYTGNISAESNNTACLFCGAVLISRRGYAVQTAGLAAPAPGEKHYRCGQCKQKTPVVCNICP
jgi:pyruvate formate lyase activating enzyme